MKVPKPVFHGFRQAGQLRAYCLVSRHPFLDAFGKLLILLRDGKEAGGGNELVEPYYSFEVRHPRANELGLPGLSWIDRRGGWVGELHMTSYDTMTT